MTARLKVLGMFAAALAMIVFTAGCGGGATTEKAGGLTPAEMAKAEDPTIPDLPAAPKFFLTDTRSETPAGWKEIPANCENVDRGGQWLFDYLVPEAWDEVGSGKSGGPGAGTSGHGTNDFVTSPDNGSRADVFVRVTQDRLDMENQLVDAEENPIEFDDFDFSVDVDGVIKNVAYRTLGPVSIAGTEVPLVTRTEGEGGYEGDNEFLTRIRYAEVPVSAASVDRQDWSATVSFTWDAERGELDEQTVRTVLESIRVPQCTQDDALYYLGLMGMEEFA